MTEPRKLDVRTLRPRDAVLVIDGTDYTVRGSLSVDTMIALFDLEDSITRAPDVRERLAAVKEAEAMIVSVLRESNDEVPDSFGCSMEEVLGLLEFLAGGQPVAAAVLELVAQGKASDALLTEREAAAAAAAGGDGADPLASPKRSRNTSSRSESTTAGRRSTGKSSAGARSASTARTRRAS